MGRFDPVLDCGAVHHAAGRCGYIFGDAPPEQLKAFATDRAAFAPNVTRLRGGDALGHVLAYVARIKVIGQGQSEKMSSADAIAVAAASQPAPLSAFTNDPRVGFQLKKVQSENN